MKQQLPKMRERIKFGGISLSLAAGIAAMFAPGAAPSVRAQAQAQASRPRFDVASLKLSKQQLYLSTVPDRKDGHVHWTTTLAYLITYAYDTRMWQISVPASAPTGTIYEVDATMDPKTTEDQLRQMFQSLLADRFNIKIHHDSKLMDGYAVTVAKTGLDIQEAKDGAVPEWPDWLPASYRIVNPPPNEHSISTTVPSPGVSLVMGIRVKMQQLCNELQRVQEVPVVNRTGITGEYFLAFEFLQRDAPVDANAPSLSDALKRLGLNLEKYKSPVDIVVVDHIERNPTPN